MLNSIDSSINDLDDLIQNDKCGLSKKLDRDRAHAESVESLEASKGLTCKLASSTRVSTARA